MNLYRLPALSALTRTRKLVLGATLQGPGNRTSDRGGGDSTSGLPVQICSDPSPIRHRASLPHSQDNLTVWSGSLPNPPPPPRSPTMGTSVGLSPRSRLWPPGPLQRLKDPLPPTKPGKEVHSHPPPPTRGPEGSPLDHTRFQLRIQLLEKENARTSPFSLSSFPGLRERNSF